MEKLSQVMPTVSAGDDEDFVIKSAASSDTEQTHQLTKTQPSPEKESKKEEHALIST